MVSHKQSTTILYIICLLLCCSAKSLAQKGSKDFDQIKKILHQQQQDWNNGNIDAFMEAY